MNEFKSQICTSVEQSKRLLELGLNPDTSDCMYSVMTKSYNGYYIPEEDRQYNLCLFRQDEVQHVGFSHYEHIPAWSLHRLIYSLMPNCVKDYSLSVYGGYTITYDGMPYGSYEVLKEFSKGDNIYDNIIDCIKWLIDNDYFNKEYL